MAKLGEIIFEYSVRNNIKENLPVLSVTNSKGFCSEYFSKEIASKDKSKYKIVPKGYFAYNPSRINVGSIDYQKNYEKVIVSPLYEVFGVTEQVNQQYLLYYLKSDISLTYIKGYAKGSVRDTLKLSELMNFNIPLPPLEEQQKIAAVLDKVTDLIDKRKQQLAKLDELIKSRFVEMFGDLKINSKNWRSFKLEEIAEVGSSKRVFVEELQEKGIPFYRGTEIGLLAEGKQLEPELFITVEHYEELCKVTGKPQEGDLLMPSICHDGRIWVVNSTKPFYFKDGRVLWIHNLAKHINSLFLLYCLKHKIMTDYSNIASGTTFAELKIFSLKACKILVPPLDLQNQFAEFVEQTEKIKVAINSSLDKLKTLKKALMQKYFG